MLEVTETALLEDLDRTRSTLAALKALGIRLAVDDFGTGYSSLSYLSAFPFDVIKIDKSFIDQLALTSGGEAMVRAVVELVHTLGLEAVAEGVEQREQADALEHLGCKPGAGLPVRPAGSGARDGEGTHSRLRDRGSLANYDKRSDLATRARQSTQGFGAVACASLATQDQTAARNGPDRLFVGRGVGAREHDADLLHGGALQRVECLTKMLGFIGSRARHEDHVVDEGPFWRA